MRILTKRAGNQWVSEPTADRGPSQGTSWRNCRRASDAIVGEQRASLWRGQLRRSLGRDLAPPQEVTVDASRGVGAATWYKTRPDVISAACCQRRTHLSPARRFRGSGVGRRSTAHTNIERSPRPILRRAYSLFATLVKVLMRPVPTSCIAAIAATAINAAISAYSIAVTPDSSLSRLVNSVRKRVLLG